MAAFHSQHYAIGIFKPANAHSASADVSVAPEPSVQSRRHRGGTGLSLRKALETGSRQVGIGALPPQPEGRRDGFTLSWRFSPDGEKLADPMRSTRPSI
jgi:hypothetical protein